MDKKKTKGTPDNVDVHVGKRIRIRRSLLGMSQEKLAEAIGITFQQIQKYERGVNRVSAGRLFQFSKILEVPISYFYDQVGNGKNASPAAVKLGFADNDQAPFEHKQADIMQSKEAIDLIRTYYSITDENKRKEILRFIKSMADSSNS
mgnify:CR=1 FL=1